LPARALLRQAPASDFRYFDLLNATFPPRPYPIRLAPTMNKLLVFWIAILLLFLGGIVLWVAVSPGEQSPRSGQEEVTDYGPPLEHFELTQSTGEPFDSRDLEGEVWIANFFYANCPSICLRENIAVQELNHEFGHRGVKFVSITVDPANDTPSRLREYAARFNADPEEWKFLTGEFDYIKRVGEDIFKMAVRPGVHTERLIVVDRSGEIRGAFHFQNPVEMKELRSTVNELLEEVPPTAES